MIGEGLAVTPEQAQMTNGQITHRSENGIVLGVDGKVLLLPGERLGIAFEGSVSHGDDNFGSGVVAVTDLRIVFVGKAGVQGIVTAVVRAVGAGGTYLSFGGSKIERAEVHGMIKRCRVYVKEKGLFGRDKLEKYDLRPKSEYKENLGEISACVNRLAGKDTAALVERLAPSKNHTHSSARTGDYQESASFPAPSEPGGTESRQLVEGASKRCPSCQTETEPSWVVCPECGVSLPRKCLKCGSELEPSWKACPFCIDSG